MLKYVFGDCTWLILFQVAIGLAFVYGISADIRSIRMHNAALTGGAAGTVVRGDKSRATFMISWGFLSLSVQQILQVSKSAEGYLVALSIVDLTLLGYLCFFNAWFRDVLLRIAIAHETKEEQF
jgi:hypothetical protein